MNDDPDRNLAIPYGTATGIRYIFLAKELLYELQLTNLQKELRKSVSTMTCILSRSEEHTSEL